MLYIIHDCKKWGVFMKTIVGEVIGNISITVCQTPEGNKFFQLKANNENVLPVLYTIEDTLSIY